MLVLSRKEGERILIGDQIEVTVVRISAHAVRIGIIAPQSMSIVREELAANAAQDRDASETATAGATTPNG